MDESGNNGLDFKKPNVSSHFIIAAVVVESAKKTAIEEQVRGVQQEFFQGSEIKSKNVGADLDRRKRVLSALAKLDIHVLAVVVDKRKLTSPGFQHFGSFYKFLYNRVFDQLVRAFPNLKLSSDQYGDDAFMAGFKNYVHRHHPHDLFDVSDFEFVKSDYSPLVQVADFVCGSLARHYDTTLSVSGSIELLRIMEPRMPVIDEWPPTYSATIRTLEKASGEFDAVIATSACRAAQDFIERKKAHSDSLVREQVACMRILLFHFTITPNTFLSSRQIMKLLSVSRDRQMKLKHFQLKIVAKLRDQDMLITGSEKGYKLPTCIEDCNQWLERGLHTMEPLLNRIRRFRNALTLASKGELDILADARYKTLRDFADR